MLKQDHQKTILMSTVIGKRTRSDAGQNASSGIEGGLCIFCKKAKYKPSTKSREKLRTSAELRADEKVKASALTYTRHSTSSSGVAVCENLLPR